ncbi:hypothetical protein B0H14DRAFT_177608 [Mycena olivaceomarginata]|nr:hypothetical protein B0H14DRAFT_177608 [Mycena olivaceomarginata]
MYDLHDALLHAGLHLNHEETSTTLSVSFAPSNDALRRAQSSSLAIFSSAASDSALAEDSEFERVRRPLPGAAGIMYARENESERATPSWERNFSRRRHRISPSDRSASTRRRTMKFVHGVVSAQSKMAAVRPCIPMYCMNETGRKPTSFLAQWGPGEDIREPRRRHIRPGDPVVRRRR